MVFDVTCVGVDEAAAANCNGASDCECEGGPVGISDLSCLFDESGFLEGILRISVVGCDDRGTGVSVEGIREGSGDAIVRKGAGADSVGIREGDDDGTSVCVK